jgi:hypothetical protein
MAKLERFMRVYGTIAVWRGYLHVYSVYAPR